MEIQSASSILLGLVAHILQDPFIFNKANEEGICTIESVKPELCTRIVIYFSSPSLVPKITCIVPETFQNDFCTINVMLMKVDAPVKNNSDGGDEQIQ